jgi:hypothetical protein
VSEAKLVLLDVELLEARFETETAELPEPLLSDWATIPL